MAGDPIRGGWVLWHRGGSYSWGFYNHTDDAGQDAHEVLLEFLDSK